MNKTIKRLTSCSIFLCLLIVSAFISIPVSEISFTLQVLVVCLIAFLLPLKDGLLVIIGYFVMGIIGIPVFSQGGGFAYVVKPSFGYLLGFILVPLIVCPFKKFPIKYNIVKYIIGGVVGLIGIYLLGTVYFIMIMKNVNGVDYLVSKTLSICVWPFLPFDLIKIVVASIAASQINRIIVKNSEQA